MKKITGLLSLATLGLLLFLATGIQAQQYQRPGAPASTTAGNNGNKPQLKHYPPNSTTTGAVTVEGTRINYKAVAGTIPLLDRNEEDTTARMSFVAYFKDGVSDMSTRPVMFLYNGGPGSATLWLHMGSVGPRWVVTEGTEYLGGAPYKLVNNDYSLLDATDLVFIDAPGTGFGRVLKGQESNYYGTDQDAAAFAQFIQRFITQFDRWNSPKYLFGESYGTLRSAVLAGSLQSMSIDLNGIVLLSQILSYGNSIDGPSRDPGNNKPYELGLPTFAATAWYHKKLPAQAQHSDLKAFLSEVEKFALSDYAHALDMGANLDDATFNKIAEQLHQYTGVTTEYIKRANLRIDGGEFRQQLQINDELSTGRLDTRYSGPVGDPNAQRSFGDPQSDAISSGYVALLNQYMRDELDYGKNMTYRNSVYGSGWDNKHRGSSGNLNVIGDLASAMRKNPKLQIMLCQGYYDLATPYFEGMYEMSQLPMPKNLQKNIQYRHYESGHMVYLLKPVLKKLHDDVKTFIGSSSK